MNAIRDALKLKYVFAIVLQTDVTMVHMEEDQLCIYKIKIVILMNQVTVVHVYHTVLFWTS